MKTELKDRGNGVIEVNLWYPAREDGNASHPNTLEIGMFHVRATDGIRVKYDFARDGWSILQASQDSDWQEVAFVQSWAREKPQPSNDYTMD